MKRQQQRPTEYHEAYCLVCHDRDSFAFEYDEIYRGYFVECEACQSRSRLVDPDEPYRRLTPTEWIRVIEGKRHKCKSIYR